ncbi:MAG: glycosyltransferase [Bacteroidaceae bacterium]|nr:glycosyltransferase [Bacteroidaceae bacterium]
MSRVTVLMAAYNAEKYLAEALDSLVHQTMTDFQVVMIDDASTDSTHAILESYANSDSRFKLVSNKVNTGQAIARNIGLKVADGDYIAMLDADDCFAPDTLEKAVGFLDDNPDAGVALLDLYYMSDGVTTPYEMRTDKTEWSGQEAFELSLDWSIHGLYLARAELYSKWPFDASCRLYSDDNTTRMHYLHSERVALCGGKYFYRRHAESMTAKLSPLRLELLSANLSMALQLKAENQPRRVLALFERERWINLTGICGLWLEHDDMVDATSAKALFKRIFHDIDKSLLPVGLKLKLGYFPYFGFSFWFFQTKIYFKLRRLSGK